ncbi:transcriptional regulator with XRE-family HTH domain [Kutzneria viridogrisea]|uniref:Transcriptional regulator with XRE-family HTH domain n=2 Tax=Kutzneria viridogrisea TaxID=47990 RepID=A0ABR6BAZ7_9PSEU|nr:transcriptional regulator with XRE-family HTH domain [Kutzneria viridogrisea]
MRCREVGHSVTAQHLCRLEAGTHKPSAPLLKALAEALGGAVDDLLDATLKSA